MFEKIGLNYKYDDFKSRLDRAKYWLENCAPDQVNRLRDTRNFDVFNSFSDEEKEQISMLHAFIKNGGYTMDELNTELYDIPKRSLKAEVTDKELKSIQGSFFKNVYRLIMDKEKGPRLYLFLSAVDVNSYVRLLDFSYPQTEEEIEIEKRKAEEAEKALHADEEEIVYGDPDTVEEVKEQISKDQFDTIDLRVCKVLKCQEIRKSHSCYKLTLFDGLKERVIVSSIKKYYKPEDLVGKKIIVVANLEPTRITGVNSEGMLLAGTNNACGCKLIFVDDMVPEGTKIC
jgi:lysyl-tRNA synthetase class 1